MRAQMDPMCPIQPMYALQRHYPDRIELFEFEDAGFTVFLSHTDEVVNLLSNIVTNDDSVLAGKHRKTSREICNRSS